VFPARASNHSRSRLDAAGASEDEGERVCTAVMARVSGEGCALQVFSTWASNHSRSGLDAAGASDDEGERACTAVTAREFGL
jgi:hypothetical protein